MHGDCYPQRLVDFQACVPSTLARAPSELLSQHQHLARQEARCQTCFCSQPASNSVLLSEKPLCLTEPQFPHLFSGEVSLVAVLWLGAEVAGESPPSWTESLCLCVILHTLPSLHRDGEHRTAPGEGKATTWVCEEEPRLGNGLGQWRIVVPDRSLSLSDDDSCHILCPTAHWTLCIYLLFQAPDTSL